MYDDLISREQMRCVLKKMFLSKSRLSYCGSNFTAAEAITWNFAIKSVINILNEQKSHSFTRVASAAHAHWEKSDIPCEDWRCSACHGGALHYSVYGAPTKSRFCPYCGAEMDEAEKSSTNLEEKRKLLHGVSVRYENCSIPVSSLHLLSVDEVAARFGLQRQNGETDNELYGRILHEFLQNPYLDEEAQNDDQQ